MQIHAASIRIVLGLLVIGCILGGIIGCGQAGGGSIIKDLITDLPAVKIQESTRIECITAANSDGLTYEWTTTGGSILGAGSIVTWTAPDVYGTYSVAVTVMDEKGRESSKDISIKVTESG
ncbi:MAG TPA: hypothetical protein G4O18_01275 [Dehalococcoidia bacterium]|nr:hypothetical protein [Dehalococcoidia bacterium]